MSKSKLAVNAGLAAMLAVGMGTATMAQADDDYIKCYGVAKAGENDCGANGHSCAGYAKTDYDPKEWVFATPEDCVKLKAEVAKNKMEDN